MVLGCPNRALQRAPPGPHFSPPGPPGPRFPGCRKSPSLYIQNPGVLGERTFGTFPGIPWVGDDTSKVTFLGNVKSCDPRVPEPGRKVAFRMTFRNVQLGASGGQKKCPLGRLQKVPWKFTARVESGVRKLRVPDTLFPPMLIRVYTLFPSTRFEGHFFDPPGRFRNLDSELQKLSSDRAFPTLKS